MSTVRASTVVPAHAQVPATGTVAFPEGSRWNTSRSAGETTDNFILAFAPSVGRRRIIAMAGALSARRRPGDPSGIACRVTSEKSWVASMVRISASTPPVQLKPFQSRAISVHGSAKLLTSRVASRPSAANPPAKAIFPATAPSVRTRTGVSISPWKARKA